MKDPTLEDPRLVSAYSVYKGLANLKSYEDTSSSSNVATAKRNKRKARKRNKKKKESEDAEVEVKTAAPSAPQSNGKTSQKALNNLPEKHGQPPVTTSSNGEEQPSTSNKGKRKKKRNRKKASPTSLNIGNNSGSITDSSVNSMHDSTVNLSDDEDEPPVKSRKTREMVPNPLASRKAAPAPPQMGKTFVKGASINGVGVNAKTPNAKKKHQDTEKPSTSARAAKKNGLPLPAKASSNSVLDYFANKKSAASTTLSSSKSSTSFTVTSTVPPADLRLVLTTARIEDSVSHAKSVVDWLLNPVTSDEFMKTHWEKKPLHIKRKHSDAVDYYKTILTTQMFDDMLRRHPVKYGVNLDITSYVNGKRETLSDTMQGRVRPAVVWDYYNNGCSVRMLNPQTYIQPLWRLNASLQEWFGSFVGANMYLTPPDSQGFAPHYDDIEAFILQIEGKKRWKLYAARNEDEVLPRFSSPNFSEESDNLGEPILDVVLEEGDLLYFPRGVIHQAQTVDGEHSLHITLSCNQLNTYGDLLKHHVNHALEKLIAKDVNFRKGLPTNYLSFMGIAHANTSNGEIKKKRATFAKQVEELVSKLGKEPADFAADAMGKKFIWDSLPPFLNSKERETTVVEDGEFMQNGKVFNRVEFGPETEVKLIRKNCVRLVVEEEKIKLYFSTENPLTYHEEDEPQFLELDVEVAPAINHIISQYPKYTKIEDLPMSSEDISLKTQIVSDMWERGLLFTKEPLEPCDYDDFESGDSDEGDDHEDRAPDADTTNASDEDDVESINLSDLPAEGASDEDNEDSDEFDDDFYDTSMGFDSDEDGDTDDDDDEVDKLFSRDDDEENSEEGSEGENGEEFVYGIDEDLDPELGEEEEDEDLDLGSEDLDDEELEEEEDFDEEEFDFDELDRMGESEEDDE